MNGHSSAEITAFSMMEISRRWGPSIGVRNESPLFVFSAGWRSGEENLARRLPFPLAGESAAAATVLITLADQLVRVASGWSRAGEAVESERGALATPTVSKTVQAQARFLRELYIDGAESGDRGRWGLVLTGLAADYALYLKLLFPEAKIVLLHRNPLETLRSYLAAMATHATVTERDIGLASGFAEHWCRTVASFSLWHKDVGGIMIGYGETPNGRRPLRSTWASGCRRLAMSNPPMSCRSYVGRKLRYFWSALAIWPVAVATPCRQARQQPVTCLPRRYLLCGCHKLQGKRRQSIVRVAESTARFWCPQCAISSRSVTKRSGSWNVAATRSNGCAAARPSITRAAG